MPVTKQCGTCEAELSGFATDGLCSACLLEQGIFVNRSAAPPPLARFGNYELIAEIARGGMGVVYKARQAGLDRLVAVKMILSGQFASAAELQRFRAEARAAAALQHPGIVAIHEVGEHEGLLFFSMDFIEGRNLAQLVRDGPWPAVRAAQCVREIAEAIHYAHERGVLHRDLKPSNVLIDNQGKPHVTDFGLAKRLDDSNPETSSSELTVSGQVLGSPNFMPPEQAAGKHRELTPASDVYSLGALLYHVLTGRPPFLADSIPATLRLVSETEPVAPRLLTPTIPRDLETICLKCLQKDPHRRYATARELADELGRFVRDDPIRARPIGPGEKFRRWTRRHPVIAVLTGVIGLLLLAVALISTVAATRLQRANRAGQERLRESLLAQAHANRWSGRPGRRFDSLGAIRKAAEIRPGLDLRNEAIAAMALVDVRPAGQWPVDRGHGGSQVFDNRFERYVRTHTNGGMTLHRTRDDQELVNWPGAGSMVYLAAFSPDDRMLAAAFRGKDDPLKVFDLANQGTVDFQISNLWVRTFRFSADGRKFALVSATPDQKNTVAIYETSGWRKITSFRTQHLPSSVDFDPTGGLLSVAFMKSRDVEIRLTSSGEIMRSLPHASGVHDAIWSPGGTLIASSCDDRNIYLWDLSHSPPQPTLLPNEAVMPQILFKHQGQLLVAVDWHSWGKIWEVNSGKELLRWPASALTSGQSHGADRWISCYQTANRSELLELSSAEECQTLHYKASSGGSAGVAYSPDGRLLISTHNDGLRIWEVKSPGESTFIPHGNTSSLQFTRDGRGFLTAEASAIFWWPVAVQDEGGTNHITIGPPKQVSRQPPGAADPANRLLIVASGKAYVVAARSLCIERRITTADGVYSAALSPDGHQCATWSLNAKAVEIWDANDGHRLATLAAPDGSSLRFSPEGRWLVTGSPEEYIFWERGSWIRHRSIPRAMTGGTHGRMGFTADGRIVALSVGRGQAALFDVTTFTPLATFEAPELNPVSGIAFSPDGTQMAVSTQGQEIRLWNLRPIRRTLAAMKLDYDLPPESPAIHSVRPLEITTVGTPLPSTAHTRALASIPPRDSRCDTNQIDLTRFYNAALSSSWFDTMMPPNDLSSLPTGLQEFNGRRFDVRGVIQLTGTHRDLGISYPTNISDIPVRRRCHSLHFLHGAGWSTTPGACVGNYVIGFADGSRESVPLNYGQEMPNYWVARGQQPTLKSDVSIIWRGTNARSRRDGYDLCLYAFQWANPRAEVEITSIEFVSSMTDVAPFLVAITAE